MTDRVQSSSSVASMNAKTKAKEQWKREAAKKKRAQLVFLLGGECKKCGSRQDLEFHHVRGRTWRAREKSRYKRMVLYFRDYDRGLIILLCHDCNKRTGSYRCRSGYYKNRKTWVPF